MSNCANTCNDSRKTYQKQDYESDQDVRWCPGCGDYAILNAMQKVLVQLQIPPEQVAFISGIGCSGRFPYYLNTYGFHTIHGRAPAIATGLKLSRPELSVWVVTGDGDGLSIGANQLLHALRRNIDIKILLFNNRVYGLTKGQYSPTSQLGQVSVTSPHGSRENAIDPIDFALTAGATFVARAVDVDAKGLQEVLLGAAAHRGSAFVEILQNCPIFNDDTFAHVTDPKARQENALILKDGAPLQFGKSGAEKGLKWRDFQWHFVGVEEADIHWVQHESIAYVQALNQLRADPFPTPIGIFRQIQRPLITDQLLKSQTAWDFNFAKTLSQRGYTWRV